MVLVVGLAKLNRYSIDVAGGKGANLGELIEAGFTVPEGFCLTTAAYKRMAALPEIYEHMRGLLVCLRSRNSDCLATAAMRLREAFYQAAIPREITTALLRAAKELSPKPLAVRSSATAEDLPEISFAGQQESFLNIISDQALLDAVRKCWGSLWSDRAIAYRQRNEVPQDRVALAVVVQRMVAARSAGVVFTANPVSGKRSELTIEASLGLGEAVVSGLVSPDRFLVDKRDLHLVSRAINDKRIQVVGVPEGGTVQAKVGEKAGRPSLTDGEVAELAGIGIAIEKRFGFPQDVEWAVAADSLHILQTRPITSLYPAPPPSARLRIYLSLNALQGIWEPLTPMGASLFTSAAFTAGLRGESGRSFLIELGARLYGDVTDLFANEIGKAFLKHMLPEVDPAAAKTVLHLLQREARPSSKRWTAWFVLRHLGTISSIIGRVGRFVFFPEQALRHIEAVAIPQLRELRSKVGRTAGLGTQDNVLSQVVRDGFASVLVPHMVPSGAAGIVCYKLAQAIIRKHGLDQHLFAVARQGLPHNPTTRMDLELWQLAQSARADAASNALLLKNTAAALSARYLRGELPKVVQRGMESFLEEYGHRAVREIDIGMPRWREDPHYLFRVLQNYLALKDPKQAPDKHFAEQTQAGEQAISLLSEEARRVRGGWYKARILGFLLRRFRRLGGLRESPKFHIMLLFEAVREILLSNGRELSEAGVLDKAEDIFFLRVEEVSDTAKDLRQTVIERKRAYNMELRREHAPRVITSEGEAFYGEVPAGGSMVLNGTPASPATVRGSARVITSPFGARIEPGEILVAPSTDPAWTPLFLTAGGLVMEAGGMMSHGSIVAREYGIPAVVSVAGAANLVADGQHVEVDGDQGLVVLLGSTEPEATS